MTNYADHIFITWYHNPFIMLNCSLGKPARKRIIGQVEGTSYL